MRNRDDLNATYALLQEHVGKARVVGDIICKDGFKFSVQASQNHMCTPRSNEGPWSNFEVGFPSEYEPRLEMYRDSEEIYRDVSWQCVVDIIFKHGGLDSTDSNADAYYVK